MLDEEPKPARVELNALEVQFSAEGEAACVAEQLETLKQLRAVPEAADEAAMGVILG